MDALDGGIRRITLPLPTRPGHVHAYLLPGEDGWTLVDTGVGLPEAKQMWAVELEEAGGRVETVFVTHFHPDHVGAAADLHKLTGAPVVQGALDYAQCELVWGNPAWSERLVDWFELHGATDDVTAELVGQSSVYRPFVRYQRDPILVEAGEHVDGWQLVAAPGHADGQLCLLKNDVLVAADHLLGKITPTVGLWPASRPDPLGDYLTALDRTIELAPRLALPGHGDPIEDPAGRARELKEHHRVRLEEAAKALRPEPQSGYQLSFALFGADLAPAGRRFAIAETLSHLERLVHERAAQRVEGDGGVTYTAA
ncbi:MAG TPA: MBL fold metallo-hydrolase [Gaiellaceae bacterium]|nr:MBL fold metallo-hydrolase [Gaiellaceae bacterium]